MKNFSLIFFTIFFISFVSCKKEEAKSDQKELLSFTLKEQIDSAIIDNTDHTVMISVATNANLKKLSPKIVISEKASIKPVSGDSIDFSIGPVIFTITAEDNSTQAWQVIVNQFFPNINQKSILCIVIDNSDIMWIGTDSGLYKSYESGYLIENILSPSKILSLFYEQSSNSLWVGTDNGLSKVIMSSSGISLNVIPSINLSNQSVQTAYVDSSSKRWFGTADGLSLNKNTTWKKANFYYNLYDNLVPLDIEKASINSIASWDGDYYFATNLYGLYRTYNYNDSVDAFTGATQWGNPYNGTAITDTMFVVFVDSKGNQWMGGTNGVQVH